MKPAELKELSESDLQDKLAEQRAAAARLKFNNAVSGVENPMQIRSARRDVARILTEINARKVNNEKAEK